MASACLTPEGFVREHADALLNLAQENSVFETVTAAAADIGRNSGVVLVDDTAAAVTVTLPAVADVPSGKKYVIKKIAGANTVTVEGNGAETIDNAANATLTAANDFIVVQSDGTEWWIVATNV